MGTFLPGVPLKKKKKKKRGRWRREDDVETLISFRFRLFSEERKVKLEPERRRRRRVTPARKGSLGFHRLPWQPREAISAQTGNKLLSGKVDGSLTNVGFSPDVVLPTVCVPAGLRSSSGTSSSTPTAWRPC